MPRVVGRQRSFSCLSTSWSYVQSDCVWLTGRSTFLEAPCVDPVGQRHDGSLCQSPGWNRKLCGTTGGFTFSGGRNFTSWLSPPSTLQTWRIGRLIISAIKFWTKESGPCIWTFPTGYAFDGAPQIWISWHPVSTGRC